MPARSLVAASGLVAVTAFLALTGPRLIVRATDDGIRAAVHDAGARTDVVATIHLAADASDQVVRIPDLATQLKATASGMRGRLPAEIRATTGAPSLAVQTSQLDVQAGTVSAVAQLAWLWQDGSQGVTWVAGTAPAASVEPPTDADGLFADDAVILVEAAMSRADADALGVSVGDRVTVTGPTRGLVTLVVSGIYAPVDASEPLWSTIPGLLSPVVSGSAATLVPRLGFLLSDDSMPDIALAIQQNAYSALVRFPADPGHLVTADAETLRARVAALAAAPSVLAGPDVPDPSVTSGLDGVLSEYASRLRGATAQASVLLVGIITVGSLALALAARLIVARRAHLIAAERARGASVASIALRLAVESVPMALLGVALAAYGARLVAPGTPWTWWPGIVVGVVAATAVPLTGARLGAVSWTGQRAPANRKDRERLRGRLRARRAVVELAAIALAVAATFAVRGRGLLQTQSQGVDLLLAATPALLAVAATVIVVRLFPPVLRPLTRAAAHRRGVASLVATARATRATSIGLPLLTLTIALGLVVFSGVTAASLHRGEERAADETVGADVRVDGVLAADAATTLRTRPGVTAAAVGTRLASRTFNLGSGVKVTLLVVDAAQYDAIARRHDARYTGELAGLPGSTDARPRAVVSPALLPEVAARGASVFVGDSIPLDVVGTTDLGRPDELLVIVDRAALAAVSTVPVDLDRLWVDGPGAAAAVDAARTDGSLTGVTVTDRAQWLDDLRASPLVGSIVSLLDAGALVLAGFAVVTLVLTVVATSTERGRTLSALRTVGLNRRTARRITLGELTPLAVAAVLAGCVIGLVIPLALTAALGLNRLTGEIRDTPVAVTSWPFVLAVGACVLALVLSVGVEALVRRGDNLGQVLRVGER